MIIFFISIDSDVIQQSRADTCLLRFNTSTVLKLYASSRHIEPPGKIIFTTDDLILQLNQTIQKPSKPKATAIHVLKHPKMRLNKIAENNRNQLKAGIAASISSEESPQLNIDKKKYDMDDVIRKDNQDRKMISIERIAPSKIENPFIYMPSRFEDRENNVYVG